uniref:RNA-directed DNA polymerase from mobile element jockey n=1 Tax=Bactrocera latifrons TaxID=174628 RepID=A0A0K8UP47_BACLA
MGKLLEKIIQSKIHDLHPEKFSPSYQFGFQKAHSTQHALFKFSNDVLVNLRNKLCTVAVSLDIEKAFDRVYHRGLIFKLVQIGFDHGIIKIISSFLSDRKFFVLINECSSDLGVCNCGVPQGSILAPLIYNIFMFDFPHSHNNSLSILYADDSLVYAHNKFPTLALRMVENHLEKINNFYKYWGVKINEAKTVPICIRNASGKGPRGVVKESRDLILNLNGHNIRFQNQMKYLGVTFTNLFKFNFQANDMVKKCNNRFQALSMIMKNTNLSTRTKILFYKVSLRPVLMYALPIWFHFSPSLMKKIEIFERKIIRFCLNKNFIHFKKRYSNKYIYSNSKVLPFNKYAIRAVLRFFDHVRNCDNPLISDDILSQSSHTWVKSKYLPPLGINKENIINDVNHPEAFCSNFYVKSTPGSHRG